MAPTLPSMESSQDSQLTEFLNWGIYRFNGSDTVFIDPVRILNQSYKHYRVSAAAYYSRFFPNCGNTSIQMTAFASSQSRKRKRRKEKKALYLNERELIAHRRHLEVRPLLVKAHKDLLSATELLEALKCLKNDDFNEEEQRQPLSHSHESELNFVELGSVWQTPLYDFILKIPHEEKFPKTEGSELAKCCKQTKIAVFNNLIVNNGVNEMEAELLNHTYIVPGGCGFHMSDMQEIHNLIPAESINGFNLIIIDPPWENSSAHQKQKYQTVPNRYFLSLPVKQLMHPKGTVVALWVTNREKLRNFVETELFPKWGVEYSATFYWLKVTADGSLISDLDLFHHRPYECLVIGYLHGNDLDVETISTHKHIINDRIVISIPGDYSRKPPVQDLLMDYVPGFKDARCIELFARELTAGWTCWGNEPLRFQDSKYFVNKSTES